MLIHFVIPRVDTAWDWLKDIGLREDYMAKSVHKDDKLAHYARACTDIIFKFPFGTQELMGIAARGNYDLRQHGEKSGKSMEYLDPITNEKYIPHVIEPSIGVDRLFLALLVSAYKVEKLEKETRTVLQFHPSIAPIKVSVFPLVNNKPEISEIATEIFSKLQNKFACEYDTSGAIGRRYRRADENGKILNHLCFRIHFNFLLYMIYIFKLGTPFCVTVDFETLEDKAVTVRMRDSMEQKRILISELYSFLYEKIEF